MPVLRRKVGVWGPRGLRQACGLLLQGLLRSLSVVASPWDPATWAAAIRCVAAIRWAAVTPWVATPPKGCGDAARRRLPYASWRSHGHWRSYRPERLFRRRCRPNCWRPDGSMGRVESLLGFVETAPDLQMLPVSSRDGHIDKDPAPRMTEKHRAIRKSTQQVCVFVCPTRSTGRRPEGDGSPSGSHTAEGL